MPRVTGCISRYRLLAFLRKASLSAPMRRVACFFAHFRLLHATKPSMLPPRGYDGVHWSPRVTGVHMSLRGLLLFNAYISLFRLLHFLHVTKPSLLPLRGCNGVHWSAYAYRYLFRLAKPIRLPPAVAQKPSPRRAGRGNFLEFGRPLRRVCGTTYALPCISYNTG